MGYLVGLIAALACLGLAIPVGMTRDRAFYATVAIIVATYYILFATMVGDMRAVAIESAIALVFITAAVVGFRTHLWIAVAALFGHGVFDAVHGFLVANPGVPPWWPAFCGTFDVVAGAGLWLVLRANKGPIIS